jgi:hypothetical protein
MTAHATRRRLSTLTDGGSPATAIIAPRLLARGVLLRSLSLSLRTTQLAFVSRFVSLAKQEQGFYRREALQSFQPFQVI